MPVLQVLDLQTREFDQVESDDDLRCSSHPDRPGTWVLAVSAGYPYGEGRFLLPLCSACAEPLRIWLNNVNEAEPEPDDDLPF